MENRILTDLIGRGELIKRNVTQKDAPTVFLGWAADVKNVVENLLTTPLLRYEANKKLKSDIGNVGGIGSKEVEPKLDRMLISLRELRNIASEENATVVKAPIGRMGSKLTTTFDEYTLGRQLGQGGTGTVYEGKASDGSTVAIKLLRAGLSIEKSKRFKNEISFCQNDWHSGIIRVIDHGVITDAQEKRLFYVMPLYEKTYRAYFPTEKDFAKLVSALTQILDAVEAAHLRKCYHRDLKPENILVDKTGTQFVVSDFGIAHFEEDDLATPIETLHADRLANFQYAAPEQRKKGAKVDHRADIYALGLIFIETFTGDVPHGTGAKKIADVSPEYSYLDELVERMRHQSPDSRYQTIGDLKSDLLKMGKIAVSFQKVNSLQKAVVSESDISGNSLVANPVKIIDVDHDGNTLICTLNHSVPRDWIEVFHSRGANTWSGMLHPRMASFHGNVISVQTPIDHATQAKGMVDQWLSGTNNAYREHLVEQARHASQDKRRKLDADAELEKKRQAFLKQVKV